MVEEARRHVTIDVEPQPAVFSIDDGAGGLARSSGAPTTSSRSYRGVTRRRGRRVRRCGDRSSKGSTRRARRNSCTSSRTAWWRSPAPRTASRSGDRCSARITSTTRWRALFGLPARQDSRRADGDRRRVRRQGRVSVDDRRPRGAARLEVGPPGEDWSTTAPRTWWRPPSGIRRERGTGPRSTRTAGLLAMDIDFVDRRRRLLHAVARRAVARNHPRGRAVLLPERPRPRPGRRDQRAAARRVPRLRRAAEPVRARAAHGSRRGGGSGCTPDELRRRNFIEPRPDERGRPGDARAGRHGGAARSRARAVRLSREARAVRRTNASRPIAEGHRLRGVHARRGFHRIGRGSPGVGRGRRSLGQRPRARADRRAPRSAREPTRCSRRLPPTRSGSAVDAIDIVQPDTSIVPEQRPDGGVAYLHGGR